MCSIPAAASSSPTSTGPPSTSTSCSCCCSFHVLDLVEGLPCLLQLLVHRQELLDPGVHLGMLTDKKDHVLNLEIEIFAHNEIEL